PGTHPGPRLLFRDARRPSSVVSASGVPSSVWRPPKDGTDFPKKYHAAPLHPAPPSSHRKNGKCEPFSRTVNTASEKPPSVTPDAPPGAPAPSWPPPKPAQHPRKKYPAPPLPPPPPSSHRKKGKGHPSPRPVTPAPENPPPAPPDGRASGIHAPPPPFFPKNT